MTAACSRCGGTTAIKLFDAETATYRHPDPLDCIAHLRAHLPLLWRLLEAAREVWDSIPATYKESDPTVERHARALNALHTVRAACSSLVEAALDTPSVSAAAPLCPECHGDGMVQVHRQESDVANSGTWHTCVGCLGAGREQNKETT